MRLNTTTCVETAAGIKEFVDWILKIGDRQMDLNKNGKGIIHIQKKSGNPKERLTFVIISLLCVSLKCLKCDMSNTF